MASYLSAPERQMTLFILIYNKAHHLLSVMQMTGFIFTDLDSIFLRTLSGNTSTIFQASAH